MNSPPSTPNKSRIIELSSTPPRATTPNILLTLPRATPLYGSPDSRAALSPAKPHPFHQSAATTSRLSRPKQPIFVVDDSSDDDIENTSARSPPLPPVPRPPPGTSYPLHPVSKTVRIPAQPTVQLLSAKARKKKPNPKILTKTQDAAEGRQIVMKGKGMAKGDANPAGLPVFHLSDREWGAPQVVYSRSKEEVEDLVGCLNRSSPLSFDMEWPISFRKGHECKTSLLQIGDGKLVVLCQISAMYYKIPLGLRRILEDPNRLKVGVNIRGDALKLRRDFPEVKMRGFLEISHMARGIDPFSAGPGKGVISLQKLTAHYLARHLPKPTLRTGKWHEQLDENQIRYAANDVQSAMHVYRRLREKLDEAIAGQREKDDGVTTGMGYSSGKLAASERLKAWMGDLLVEEKEERERPDSERKAESRDRARKEAEARREMTEAEKQAAPKREADTLGKESASSSDDDTA